MPRVSVSSALTAPAVQVWARATSMAGVNHELAPLVRMTVPRVRRLFLHRHRRLLEVHAAAPAR